MKDIFAIRENVKPYEYPKLIEFAKAIQHSFWEIDEFDFTKDMRDFKKELSKKERDIIEKSMLAINVVENKVKSFWARIDIRMPKPEIGFVGATMAGNEVIHAFAYSELLEKLRLEEQFKTVLDIPCMEGRVKYLNKYLSGIKSRSNKEFTKSLILFTLLVENVSLFSQFLILSSFRKYRNLLKNFGKVVESTSKDEGVHGMFGAAIVNILREEQPEWFDQEMEDKTRRAIRKAYRAELGVLDWIFQDGELDFLPKESIIEYLKTRFNLSLSMIGYDPEFEIDNKVLKPAKFFDRISKATVDFDFFDGRSTAYAKGKSFDADTLF